MSCINRLLLASCVTIRIATLLLLTALAAAGQAAPPADTPPAVAQTSSAMLKVSGDYGGWWKALSDSARDNYVDGFTAAMQRAQFLVHNQCMNNARSIQPGPEYNTKLQESLSLCGVAETFDYKADLSLRAGLDKFYKDPLNAGVAPEFAMEYLRDQLKQNKTAIELLNELNEWRRTMPPPLPTP